MVVGAGDDGTMTGLAVGVLVDGADAGAGETLGSAGAILEVG
jgi:hypothetical protein